MTVRATIKLAHALRTAENSSRYTLLPVELQPGYPTTEPGDGRLAQDPKGHTWDRAQRAKHMARAREAMHTAGATSKAPPTRPITTASRQCRACVRLLSILTPPSPARVAPSTSPHLLGVSKASVHPNPVYATGGSDARRIWGSLSLIQDPPVATHAAATVRPTVKPPGLACPPIGAAYGLQERLERHSALYRREAGNNANAPYLTAPPQQQAMPGCQASFLPLPWETGYVPPAYQPPADTARSTTVQPLPMQWACPSRPAYIGSAGHTAFLGPNDQWVGPSLMHQ